MHLVASNVERALVNGGVISEEQRVDLASQIESIDEPTALNITAEFRKLEKIKRNLEEETERRLAHQRDIWLGLSQRLGEIASDEDGRRFRELVETALNDRATRVVDEYIAKVRAHLERNELFVLTESEEQSRNYLAEFSQFRLAVNRGGKNKAFRMRRLRQKKWPHLGYQPLCKYPGKAIRTGLNRLQVLAAVEYSQGKTRAESFAAFHLSGLLVSRRAAGNQIPPGTNTVSACDSAHGG